MDLQRRIVRTVATVAAGFLASHVVTVVWRLATRQAPPRDTDDLAVATSTAVVFAGVLAAATAVAQTLVGRYAAKVALNAARRSAA
jgi:uncharacterized membrane protein required for colicin V production